MKTRIRIVPKEEVMKREYCYIVQYKEGLFWHTIKERINDSTFPILYTITEAKEKCKEIESIGEN